MKNYELEALLIAERYGLVEYERVEHKMTFKKFYMNEGRFLHTINLNTMEETVKKIEKAYWEK